MTNDLWTKSEIPGISWSCLGHSPQCGADIPCLFNSTYRNQDIEPPTRLRNLIKLTLSRTKRIQHDTTLYGPPEVHHGARGLYSIRQKEGDEVSVDVGILVSQPMRQYSSLQRRRSKA